MITTTELSAIRARADAATPGPWEWEDVDLDRVWPTPSRILAGQHGEVCSFDADDDPLAADAQFIAHARADIPALLAEIDRLHGVIGLLTD